MIPGMLGKELPISITVVLYMLQIDICLEYTVKKTLNRTSTKLKCPQNQT